MNILSPLYFPDSTINTSIRLSLATCFHETQLLKPVTEASQQLSSQSNDCVMENSFCQVHIPCPLPEGEQKGFLRLVQDIRTQGSTFVDQLKMMTLADMSSPGRLEQESSRKILSALFPQGNSGQEEKDRKTALELWQARLILKLAEIIDEEETLVAKQMGSINDLETRMLKNLQGTSDISADDHLIFPNPHQSPQQPQAEAIRKRLKAWSTLYRYWDSQDQSLWVTTSHEAADILLEKYERIQGRQADQFLSLSLPISDRKDEKSIRDFHERIKLFQTDAAQLRTQFTNLFIHALNTKADNHHPTAAPSQDSETIKEQWREHLARHFPEHLYSRASLTSYLLNNITFGKIVDKKRGLPSPFNNAILSVIG